MIRQVMTREIKRRRSAFSLMELMIVVAIIVVLAGLGGTFYFGVFSDSKVSMAHIQAKHLHGVITQYLSKHDDFPNDLSELLKTDPPLLDDEKAIIDPWNKQYQTRQNPNGTYEVFTTNPKNNQEISSKRIK